VRKLFLVMAALGATVAAFAVAWRRNPRMGTRFTNDVLNPLVVGRGMAGVGRSELGTLEHFGRRSGTRRLTPIHPVPTGDGFRIVVPLGPQSQWAQNVLAAGHCRLQLHDTVYDLDEPVLLAASEVPDIPTPAAKLMDRFGVQYLVLHRFAERAGQLEPMEVAVETTPNEPTPAGVS
jgi:deazaflavin-dependent oxidoreductase (nitroreductase family)